MYALSKGRYRAFFTTDERQVARAQALRARAFVGVNASGEGRDVDAFDARCQHVLIEDAASGALVCCFRLLLISEASDVRESYSAQYYELSALEYYRGNMVEMGRFCIDPDLKDPDIQRIAWAAMTQLIDGEGIALLFGCSSFRGTDAEAYRDVFAQLAGRYLAPPSLMPGVKAEEVVPFARDLTGWRPDPRKAALTMPTLLRSYLTLGGWVSDHAVVDRHLGTLHVFTGLEVEGIPESRKRLMRAMAG